MTSCLYATVPTRDRPPHRGDFVSDQSGVWVAGVELWSVGVNLVEGAGGEDRGQLVLSLARDGEWSDGDAAEDRDRATEVGGAWSSSLSRR